MPKDEDAVTAAVNELYSADPDGFMQLRAELSASAKKAGNPAAAKQIAALRKPTRSAYTVNKLARTDPDAAAELLDLGSQLRDAERSVDAQQIRELTTRRRRLLDELTRRAFEIIHEPSPSSALRDEVVSTLTAALADNGVAEHLVDGTLVKPARWEGFGFGGAPDLALVPDPTARARVPRKPPARKGVSDQEGESSRQLAAAAIAEEHARVEAEAEEAKREKLVIAQRAAEDAQDAVVLATDEEQQLLERLRTLEEQVTDARRAVDEARVQLRRAEIRQRRTEDALRRLER